MKYLLFILGLFCCSHLLHGQTKLDTVVLHHYDKNGRIDTKRVWIDSSFRFADSSFIEIGEDPSYWDTLEAMNRGTVYIFEYDKSGKLDSETKEIDSKTIWTRMYYYGDSVYGYDEYDHRDGALSTKAKTYEFWLDGTPRIIGYQEGSKKEGRYQTFYQNGNRQCDCFYRNGERDSLQSIYFENGQLQTRLLYKEGRPWEVFVSLDMQGNPLEMGTLKDGNGSLLIYDDYGKLLYTVYYEKGKEVKTVYPE